MTTELFFFGNALLDISAGCDKSMLIKYNLKEDDNCKMLEEQNGLLEEIMNQKSLKITPGGSVQNSARVAKWIFNKKDLIKVTFVGSLGNDNYANILEQHMKSSGVNTIYHHHDNIPTGVSAGLITSDNERTLCTRLGAAALLDVSLLNEPPVKEAMMRSSILYIAGYLLSHSVDAAIHIAKFAFEHNKMFSINLSGMYICESYAETLVDCISYSQIVFGNYREAKALIKALGKDITDIEECAKYILSLSKTSNFIVVITQGPKPVVVANKKCDTKLFNIPEVKGIGDTIGCGDALVGSFLASYCLYRNVDSAIRYGISAAREVAKNYGCTFPVHFDSSMLIN